MYETYTFKIHYVFHWIVRSGKLKISLQFIVSSFKLCDKTYASGLSDPGLPLDKATNF